MFNIFRMEKYRAIRSKVTWITIGIMCALTIICIIPGALQKDMGTYDVFKEYSSIISSQILIVFWVIAMSTYIAGEYKNGFVKSVAGQIPARKYLVISKFYYCVMYTLIVFLLTAILTVITSVILYGDKVIWEFNMNLAALLIAQFVLHIAFSCIFIFICSITRSSALGIGAGIFMGCGITKVVYMVVNWLLFKAGISNGFDISKYMLESNIDSIVNGVGGADIIRAFIVAIVYIVVLISISSYIVEKRDI